MIERAQATRDQFSSMGDRFTARAACNSEAILQASIARLGAGRVAFSIGYSNNGEYGDCLQNVVVPISFEYIDTTGNMEPDDDSIPLTADTTYVGTPVLETIQTTRQGNFIVRPDGVNGPATRHTYRLGGTWPHYYIVFGAVALGGKASVYFVLNFATAVSANVVEFIIDGYQMGSAEEDFEKGPHNGAAASLRIICTAAHTWLRFTSNIFSGNNKE